VQGVGFRPFAQRIAARYGLTGFVQNDANGVLLEIEGAQCEAFLVALEAEAPPLATIESVDVERMDARGDCAFSILQSAG
ncbi:acylphosphatase, partial [Klebsiella pneumoniae]|nr:acylphosphatase [Klebsiella pneumoniae]